MEEKIVEQSCFNCGSDPRCDGISGDHNWCKSWTLLHNRKVKDTPPEWTKKDGN